MVLVLEEQNADFDLGTKSEGITERIIHWKFNNLNINHKNIVFVRVIVAFFIFSKSKIFIEISS